MKTTEILEANQTCIREAIESRSAAPRMDADDYCQIVAMKALQTNSQSLSEVMDIVAETFDEGFSFYILQRVEDGKVVEVLSQPRSLSEAKSYIAAARRFHQEFVMTRVELPEFPLGSAPVKLIRFE